MGIIKSIIKPMVKMVFKYHAGFKLSRLRSLEKQTTDKIVNAIQDALKNHIDPEEKRWIDRIEEKRSALNSSSSTISVTDYGAGNPTIPRSETEMYQGVTKVTTVAETCRIASKPYFWSLLLFKLIREFKPSNCIELGTCLGISGAYQAAALSLNNNGRLVTLEGANSLASLAEKNFQELDLDNVQVVSGRFQDTMARVLTENSPIDYAFIDGHHDEKATITYFEKMIPFLSKNAIIIFDDISWSDGMRNAWDSIEKNKIVKISLDLRAIGICILDENSDEKYRFRIPML